MWRVQSVSDSGDDRVSATTNPGTETTGDTSVAEIFSRIRRQDVCADCGLLFTDSMSQHLEDRFGESTTVCNGCCECD